MSEIWNLDRITLGAGGRPRLNTITLSIAAGVTAILGPSGSGKTSLLNLLVGFEVPGAGTIRTKPSSVFWCPADDGLWPQWSVREHLTRVAPRGTNVAPLLEMLDLSSLAAARPERLSQGERARVALARALASRSAVLVLDEPLVHVDARHAVRYVSAVQNWIRESGTSVVLSTHSPETAMVLAQHAVCLNEGRLVHAGLMQSLYDAPGSAELAWYLGPANWIEAPDNWLSQTPSIAEICLRPERLSVESDPESPLTVVKERFAGSVAEVELRHAGTGQVKRYWHRPERAALQPDQTVRLRVLQ